MNFVLKDAGRTGLSVEEWAEVQMICSRFSNLDSVVLFGSRAQGNHRIGSDVDLAVSGKGFSRDDLLLLAGALNEDSSLPYHFDVVDYQGIKNEGLKQHIDQKGIQVFDRARNS